MNLDNFTIKTQETIQRAVQLAQEYGAQAIEPGHIFLALNEKDPNILGHIFQKSEANLSNTTPVIEQIVRRYPKVAGGEPYLSNASSKALQHAQSLAKKKNNQYVSIDYLIAGLLSANDEVSRVLKDNGLTEKNILIAIEELHQGGTVNSPSAEESYMVLSRYAINLNEMASIGRLDPVIGRDEEIRRILQILSRRTKNNPILIGEPGVGKTAIAEGLAHRIIEGDVPDNLKSTQVYSLDMGALVAGAKYKGEFEERLKAVVKEVTNSNGEIVLFIDEIHTLVGAGKGEGAMDAANILKPALARGELRAIGATTLNEFQKFFEKDKALERRFQSVLVDEPDVLDAISILRGLRERYESHHKVRIRDEAIIAAVELSDRYISDRFLPDKAIDLIDEAASRMRIEMNSVPHEVDELERRIKQLEIEREGIKREGDKAKVDALSREIADLSDERNKLKAKWKAEKDLIDKIQKQKSDIEEFKQLAAQAERDGDFGKVAELRYGRIKAAEDEIARLKDQLSEKQHDFAMINEEVTADDVAEIVSHWTGIPVSKMVESERVKLLHLEDNLHKRVIGQDTAVQAVADAVRRSRAGLQDAHRPVGSFLFLGTTGVGKTELAKALAESLFADENKMTRIDMSEYQERHSVSRLIGAPPGYVGYDEGGQLTEAVRKKPYSVVLLDEIEKAHPDVYNILLQVLDDGRLTDNKGRVVNFKNTIIIMTSNVGSNLILERLEHISDETREQVLSDLQTEVFALLRKTIRPEFLNRIDDLIMFAPLNESEIRGIVDLQINHVIDKLMESGLQLHVSDAAIQLLAAKGFDPVFGARPVKRVLQRELLNKLSKAIISGQVEREKPIKVDAYDDEIIFA